MGADVTVGGGAGASWLATGAGGGGGAGGVGNAGAEDGVGAGGVGGVGIVCATAGAVSSNIAAINRRVGIGLGLPLNTVIRPGRISGLPYP